ncbi:hypothetical protein MicB006_2868 [Micromonospora sp. B006]|nr:hypothetical protein MicB006_2868 [Micromonospora sp. B006]
MPGAPAVCAGSPGEGVEGPRVAPGAGRAASRRDRSSGIRTRSPRR